MKLTSSAFIEGGKIPSKFTCQGENINPELHIKDVPSQAKALVLILDDPDVPEFVRKDRMYDHWVVYNIPADAKSIPADAGDPKKGLMPGGAVQGRTDFGTPGYGGPCPPPGKPHHYYFRLYALKVPKLELPADATAAMVGFNVKANSLAEAQILGLYGR